MTKYFELNWKIPVPPQLQEGTVGDRWVEDKENFDCEPDCKFKVDDCGFYIYWKSQYRVSKNPIKLCRNSVQSYFPYGKHLKAIQTKSPFSKVRIQLFSIKEVEIALFPDFYGNCITTAAPLIYEKSLLSV